MCLCGAQKSNHNKWVSDRQNVQVVSKIKRHYSTKWICVVCRTCNDGKYKCMQIERVQLPFERYVLCTAQKFKWFHFILHTRHWHCYQNPKNMYVLAYFFSWHCCCRRRHRCCCNFCDSFYVFFLYQFFLYCVSMKLRIFVMVVVAQFVAFRFRWNHNPYFYFASNYCVFK